jgi:hypothetical protein
MLTQSQYAQVTDDLAASIEPALVAAIDANREQILSGVNVLTRWVANRMWSAVLAMVPILARIALTAILDRFGAKTINEIMALIYAHKASQAAMAGATQTQAQTE